MRAFRKGLIALLFAATTVLLAGPAAADDWETCRGDATPDLIISRCTAAVESGLLEGKLLAYAFFFRGYAYERKFEYDRAIQDYDQAVRFDPQNVTFFSMRGSMYDAKSQYDRAIQDYRQAIRLGSDSTFDNVLGRTTFNRLLEIASYFFTDFALKKVCEPIMRDVFSDQSTNDAKKLESVLIGSCQTCFMDRAKIDLPGEELVDLVLVLTGGSDSLTSESKNRTEAKYDALFKRCSEQLNVKLEAELNSAK